MALIEKHILIQQLSPPLDALLTGQLLDEFLSLERRFILRDWEPAELDGGQFAEILARILYHMDSGGAVNYGKKFDDCIKYIEDPNSTHSHNMAPRHTALHVAKVLRTIYTFRSQRGSVHISPTYSANHMDAKLMIECARWCLTETLRIFMQAAREDVARIVRELLQFDVPCVGRFQDSLLVQRTDLSPEEEILVLLHYAGDAGFSRSDLGQHAQCSPAAVTQNLKKLSSSELRQIIQVGSGNYRLTDLGAKRIRDELAGKLLID